LALQKKQHLQHGLAQQAAAVHAVAPELSSVTANRASSVSSACCVQALLAQQLLWAARAAQHSSSLCSASSSAHI
jgi:hypothetical protein